MLQCLRRRSKATFTSTKSRCTQGNKLYYWQAQFSICVYPSDDAEVEGYGIMEDSLDSSFKCTVRHLESNTLTAFTFSQYPPSNSVLNSSIIPEDGVVRFIQYSTVKTVITTILHPIAGIFPLLNSETDLDQWR